jgi:REP element-mobilizing transposase RayT
MPATHLSLHYHLVFSTKERYPFILQEWRSDLHAYLGGMVKGLNRVPLAIGGVADHVHLLVGLRATHRLDYVIGHVKADSSGWVHKRVGQRKSEWQSGYLGLTVSPSQIERVRRYVLNQESHHRRKSFQDEYLELLKLSGIEYDSRYLW